MKHLHWLLAASLCAPAFAAPAPSKDIHGVTYPNACSAAELKRLKSDVLAQAGERAPEAAWDLVRLLMCGTGAGAEAAVMRHAPKRMAMRSEDTGGDGPVRSLEDTTPALLLANREVWDANVSSDADGEFSLTYLPNEACLRSLRVRFNGRGWLVVEIGDACD